jgi:CRP-like cAMP-binding protein
MASHEELLGRIPIFSVLDPKEVKKLAADANEVSYPAGTSLAESGTAGITFSVVVEGTLEVSLQGRPVRTLGPGDYFGEMALIDKESRSASVVATSECRCLVFTRWVFRPFAVSHPEVAWALLEMMVDRVREAEAR